MFLIKVRNYIIHAKESHPDCIIDMLKNGDQVKVGSILGWTPTEVVEDHFYIRGEWYS